MALRANIDSETEKIALEESLSLIKQAEKKCRWAQAESVRETFLKVTSME